MFSRKWHSTGERESACFSDISHILHALSFPTSPSYTTALDLVVYISLFDCDIISPSIKTNSILSNTIKTNGTFNSQMTTSEMHARMSSGTMKQFLCDGDSMPGHTFGYSQKAKHGKIHNSSLYKAWKNKESSGNSSPTPDFLTALKDWFPYHQI